MARNVEFNEDEAIQKAMEVFWKKGYNGASVRNLTDAMNINSSSLYNTVGDKHQLFVKCIRNYTQGRMRDALAHAGNIKSPLKAIINYINDAVNTILYNNDSCLAIKTTFEVAASDPDVQAVLKEDNDFTHKFLLDLINRAIQAKEIDADTDAETLTDFIIMMFTGWHESYILHKNPIKIKKMAKYLISQISN
ncbi:transcriptional regulator, TetR family [Pedobacter westerhofensis]|jgi:TetR/AcrR family transcriptional repressor of nem operon|uniref:Transcriptional regulator, TetR family n=1 Tax=Pedobacter westerhofensis TaxID=425512 RepID=A0A521DTU1_9SPHI|nr:TetR/AcrR family transcriptional regulator [Pedobacter westerhofensis]SMO75124.1 transcriptional regulator, TetR family [Pedobacter westerhofensis]